MPKVKIIWTNRSYHGDDSEPVEKFVSDTPWEEISIEDLGYLQAHLYELRQPRYSTPFSNLAPVVVVHETALTVAEQLASIRERRKVQDEKDAKAKLEQAKKAELRKADKAKQKEANEKKEFERLQKKFRNERIE